MCVCQCMKILSYLLISLSWTINTEAHLLFEAIKNCDIPATEKILNTGIDININDYVEELNPNSKIFFNALGLAYYQFCGKILDSIDDVQQRYYWILNFQLSMTDLLLKYGADPAHLIDNPEKSSNPYFDFKIPVAQVPFYTDGLTYTLDDNSFSIALQIYKKLVENGMNPNVLDEKGNNILFVSNIHGIFGREYNFLLELNVSYRPGDPKSKNLSASFPGKNVTYSEIESNLAPALSKVGFSYIGSTYENEFVSHPIARQYYNTLLMHGLAEENAEKRKDLLRMIDLIDTELNNAAKLIANEVVGKWNIPLLAQLMFMGCPTNDPITGEAAFDFSDYPKGTYDEYFFQYAYDWLKTKITLGYFDLSKKDERGIDMATYASLLCPPDIVRLIVGQVNTPYQPSSLEAAYHFFQQQPSLKKRYALLLPFNGSVENFLILKGLGASDIQLAKWLPPFDINQNGQSIKVKKKWKTLQKTGLDLGRAGQAKAWIPYRFKRWTNIKKTRVALDHEIDWQTFTFQGKPIEALIENQYGSEAILRPFVRGEIKESAPKQITYKIKNGNLYAKAGENSNPDRDSVPINQGDPNDKWFFIFTEAITEETTNVIRYHEHIVDFKQRDSVNLEYEKLKELDEMEYLTDKFVSLLSSIKCEEEICSYLVMKKDKESKNYSLYFDEKKFQNERPALYFWWRYLNQPLDKKRSYLDKLKNDKNILENDEILAYALNFIKVNYEDSSTLSLEQERNSLFIIDFLWKLEFSGKLVFIIDDLKKVLALMRPISEEGKFIVKILNYLTGVEEINSFYTYITSQVIHIKRFALYKSILQSNSSYYQLHQKMGEMINNNIDILSSSLKLTKEDKDEILKSFHY